VRAAFERMYAAWGKVHGAIDKIAVGPDIIVAHLHFSIFGSKTGVGYGFAYLEFCRFKDGKIIELRPFHWDTAHMNKILAQ